MLTRRLDAKPTTLECVMNRRRARLMAAAAFVAVATVLTVLAGTAAARSCGSVTNGVDGEGEGAAVEIHASGVGCANARRVVRRCISRGDASTYRVSHLSDGRYRMRRGGIRVLYTPVVGASSCEPEARDCGSVAYAPNTDWGATTIEARYVGCRLARKVARAAKRPSAAQPPYRLKAEGFRCDGYLVDEGMGYVQYSCRRGDAYVGFRRF
jgi:hypothetical protein